MGNTIHWEIKLTGVGSVLSTAFGLILKLSDPIKKYRQKKQTESRFMSAFENEITKFSEIYGRALELSEEEVRPILERERREITAHDVNELLEVMMPIPLIYADWIETFVSFAKACSEVSTFKGFMDYLRESNIMLYDFVIMMKGTYIQNKNRVVIDGKYYRFFKTYENDIFGKARQNEIDAAVQELEPYWDIVRRFVKRVRQLAARTSLIKRSIRKGYAKNYRKFLRMSESMVIEKTSIIDLMAYTPRQLLPISVFIEELSLS
jgi:hypothetical protein